MKTRLWQVLISALRLQTFLVLPVCFCLPSPSNRPDGRVHGTLTDATGAGVAGVQVTAEREGTTGPQVWTATSSMDGAYSLLLPAGRYRIRFERSAFTPSDVTVNITAGQDRSVDLRLELARYSENIVVTAEAEPILAQETSASVTIITRQEVEQRKAVILPDVLLYSPGVAMGKTGPEGGQTSIFLNGANSSFTKVLVDGTAVNEPGNAVDFANFTLDNIDKVEVVRGAESALYGTDAVAGVIQVFTHRGTTHSPAAMVFAEGGSLATGRTGAQLSGLTGPFDYSAAASYYQSDGQGPNDRFLIRTLSSNTGWKFTDTNHIRLSLRNSNSDAGIPGQTLLLAPNLHEHDALHFFSGNATWDIATGKHWSHQLTGIESYNRDFTDNRLDPVFPFSSTLKYNRAGVHLQSSYLLPRFGATAGYQYEVENGFLSSGHLRRNNQGGFLDFRWLPHPRVVLNFGARAEANGSFGTRVVPRAGASLAVRYGRGLWGDTRARVFYGQGIKEPRFDQSYGSFVCFPGNPSLRPEGSHTWNVGVDQKLASDHLKVSAEYFSNRFYNIISFGFLQSPPGSGCFFFGTFFNTDEARARGTNLSAEIRPLAWLMVAGNYTFDDSRVLKSPNSSDPALIVGNRLIRRPVHSGSATMNASFRHVNLNFAGYFSGTRTDSDFLSFRLGRNPGYARFDLAGHYALVQGVTAYLRIVNVFDKQYQDAIGYPALGREVRVGINYRFGGRN